MKKIILLIAMMLLFTGVSLGQGFFKPVKKVVENKLDLYEEQKLMSLKSGSDTIIIAPQTFLLFRPTVMATLGAIDFYQKPAVITSFTTMGFGLSVGKFSADKEAYCYYSVNALLLTSIKIGETESAKLGGAITVDVFNKLIGTGVGYLDGKFMPLVTVSYSF